MTTERLLTFISLMAVSLAISSCKDGDRPTPPTDVVTRLCQHIIQNRQKIIVDTNQAEIVWSDGAILEAGTDLPAALQELISHPTHHHDIRSFLKQLDRESGTAWREASVHRSPQGASYSIVRSVDGKISAKVESLYVDYLRQQYPGAIIRVRGEFEPVIFLVAGQIRASVMPVKF
jgi:hypothetical protein